MGPFQNILFLRPMHPKGAKSYRYKAWESEMRGMQKTVLCTAILRNNLGWIKFLVQNGADVNACSDLFLIQSREVADYLISCGMDVNKLSLYLACKNGLIDTIEMMISIGAKVTTKDENGNGCLDGLFKRDSLSKLDTSIITRICEIVLLQTKDIDALTKEPKDFLWRVCRLGSLELFNLFYTEGVKIDSTSDCDAPILGAIESENLDLVKYLVEHHGAVINARSVRHFARSLNKKKKARMDDTEDDKGSLTEIVNYLSSFQK